MSGPEADPSNSAFRPCIVAVDEDVQCSTDPIVQEIIEDAEQLMSALDARLPRRAELSVLLVEDARMQALNATWRDKDQPTDVLSFPGVEPAAIGPALLGDVVLNLDAAARQAVDHGLSEHEERRFLLIHGLLHLLGHDHLDEPSRRVMEREEQRLWEALGGQGVLR